jgi:hypothetical protein
MYVNAYQIFSTTTCKGAILHVKFRSCPVSWFPAAPTVPNFLPYCEVTPPWPLGIHSVASHRVQFTGRTTHFPVSLKPQSTSKTANNTLEATLKPRKPPTRSEVYLHFITAAHSYSKTKSTMVRAHFSFSPARPPAPLPLYLIPSTYLYCYSMKSKSLPTYTRTHNIPAPNFSPNVT